MDLTANVVLGSSLHVQSRQLPRRTHTAAPTGCAAIDTHALDGGFRYGEVATIAGANGTGKTLVLARHTQCPAIVRIVGLIQAGEAVVIDTNGTFAAARLRDVFATRLRAEPEDAPPETDLDARAVSFLDRVKFTRAFDVVGISQAVSETSDGWVAQDRDVTARRAQAQAIDSTVIPSSQADEDEGFDDDSVTLQPYEGRLTADSGGVGLIVIDNIANHFGRELSRDPVRGGTFSGPAISVDANLEAGQALLASFYRTLDHLTKQRRICTILVNNAVNNTQRQEAGNLRRHEESVSLFASELGKPALGQSFTYLVDLSVWMSTMPETQDAGQNARARYSSRIGAGDYAGIFEVLKDRKGDREGSWAAFGIRNETSLVSTG